MCYCFNAKAGNPIVVKLVCNTPEAAALEKQIREIALLSDSSALQKHLQQTLSIANSFSYLLADVQLLSRIGDTLNFELVTGPECKWVKIKSANIDEELIRAAGFKESAFEGKQFNPQIYTNRVERMLSYFENNGYPFATISLDSVELDTTGGLSAVITLEKGKYIVFDSVNMAGDVQIHRNFLQKYLGVKPGAVYQEALLKNADSRLSQLLFLKVGKPSGVYFYGNKAKPLLYLQNRKASSVDGIIGFAPNSAVNNKLLLTGEANLRLQNLFQRGISFDLNYRSFLASSQDLRIKTVLPYILNTSLAFDYELNLLKLDSTFLDVRNEIGLQYRFIGADYFKFFYSVQNATLIKVDTLQIIKTKSLPTSSDLLNQQYGVGVKLNRYDYFFNPRKGYSVEGTFAVGIKKIVRNPTIDELRFADGRGGQLSIYDTINLQHVQYRMQAQADWFIPLGRYFTLKNQLLGGHNVAENLFFNELFRIGGIRTLKGFDEQSIFASSYIIANTELRYLLQQNSNVLLFWNGAWYRNTVRRPSVTDKPYGFGAGLNFETGAGIFALYYAVGSEFGQAIQFENAKIHFGFTALF